MLKETFSGLLIHYTTDCKLVDTCWHEIETSYSGRERHYHTLRHLDHLLLQLTAVKAEIRNWDVMLFTLYYHDIIYNALASDNEEKSAELAGIRLTQMGAPADAVERCKEQILATKSHLQSSDHDTNYFTDADLSILGQNWETYTTYFTSVRKEYAVYPDTVYNPGRKKVLEHFLAMEQIYKTDYFQRLFEKQAKENLKKEWELLTV